MVGVVPHLEERLVDLSQGDCPPRCRVGFLGLDHFLVPLLLLLLELVELLVRKLVGLVLLFDLPELLLDRVRGEIREQHKGDHAEEEARVDYEGLVAVFIAHSSHPLGREGEDRGEVM